MQSRKARLTQKQAPSTRHLLKEQLTKVVNASCFPPLPHRGMSSCLILVLSADACQSLEWTFWSSLSSLGNADRASGGASAGGGCHEVSFETWGGKVDSPSNTPRPSQRRLLGPSLIFANERGLEGPITPSTSVVLPVSYIFEWSGEI